jgi:hypothetical protein
LATSLEMHRPVRHSVHRPVPRSENMSLARALVRRFVNAVVSVVSSANFRRPSVSNCSPAFARHVAHDQRGVCPTISSSDSASPGSFSSRWCSTLRNFAKRLRRWRRDAVLWTSAAGQ